MKVNVVFKAKVKVKVMVKVGAVEHLIWKKAENIYRRAPNSNGN